ncbi:ABC transporter permease [Amycolatopsis sp. CA-230715]|uniref:ABC transporter permease n=1 Tax=Amycolatopsis sp. CA-230715 TaxID=2745196 RepID=UPI001C00E0D8|nr:ABC transporter permease [Amycolatopsis sp. CA-230715]QWF78795.1 Daunorubicin/doxorubicin resistance ABC transporter permease protein DrrB [Amycolatopsis sp. CA-230715]
MTTTAVPAGPAAAITEIRALAGRRVRHLLRAPGRLIGITMNPLVMMLAMGYLFKQAFVIPGGGDYLEYLMAGVAMQVGLASIGPTAIGVSMDLRGGLIDRFRSLPIGRGGVLLGHSIADLVASLAGLVIVMAAGLALGWRPHTDALSVLAGFGILIAFIYAMLWVGILLGMVLKTPESIDAVGSLVLVGLSFLSTALISASAMPSWIRPVVEWNPVSSVTTALRELWGNPGGTAGATFATENSGVVIAVALAAILLVTTALSFRRYRKAEN